MAQLADFLIRVSKMSTDPKHPVGDLTIIINRTYAELEKDLREVFNRKEKVKMFVDRRYEERRTRANSSNERRRKAERRKEKEGLIEAIISL